MPYIQHSTYQRPFYLFNPHLETILPAIIRKVKGIAYERERLELDDGDFMDLDWLDKGSKNLVLLAHGLEGDSQRHYMKGMAKLFSTKGWDVLAWNCRSCSGELNRTPKLYHHGDIEDIEMVITHALGTKSYERMVLVGFSMGGSIILKYLGVNATVLPEAIHKAVVFSTPCDLRNSAERLNEPGNKIYRDRFLKMLAAKISQKATQFPGLISMEKLQEVQLWEDFDHHFSAPINGYKDAEAFYQNSSAIHFIPAINRPTLLINAQNDPILASACSPIQLAEQHPYFFLEYPTTGGHVGFSLHNKPYAWSEYRAWDFVQSDG